MRDYRLLGPFEVHAEDRVLPLPGGRPRALLARLLLDAGRVVSTDELVDALWGERPPVSAPKLLQAHVSQLRGALGPEAIETTPPGYLVRAPVSDLGRFEALSDLARSERDPARQVALYREALALWRGPALIEFRRAPFAAAAARRLAELRLDVLGRCIDAELELGEHERILAELQGLVAQEPLREQARRQLMLALYRCGRQAEALASYREGRRLLSDELGIEPGPALRELEGAILRHEVPPVGQARPRGSIVCSGAVPLELVAPLAAAGRELLLVDLVADPAELATRGKELQGLSAGLGTGVRAACFTSTDPAADLARLADEQQAALLVVGELHDGLLEGAGCDLAWVGGGARFAPDRPVLVPFGGGRDEWAALELGAWLASAHDLPLRLLGTEAVEGRRDASRMLAGASLALQRFAATSAEPVLVAPGAEGILAEQGSVIVASLPRPDVDATRRTLMAHAPVPVLLVGRGLRPGGLAPEASLTRFSWSLADGD